MKYMKPRSFSCLQAKRFFAALCYTNQSIALFERQLVELPEKDWATVLLASIIIDNSGIVKARDDLLSLVFPSRSTSRDAKVHPPSDATAYSHIDIDEKQRSLINSSNEYWFEVPNQYILQNRAWLYPVIRACDPEKTTFTEKDYGSRLLDNLSEKLSIKLKTKGERVFVELNHSLDVICFILAQPKIIGASRYEVDSVIRAALTDPVFFALRSQSVSRYHTDLESSIEDSEELSRGLIFLVIMTLLFAATGLFFGFYCASDEERPVIRGIVP